MMLTDALSDEPLCSYCEEVTVEVLHFMSCFYEVGIRHREAFYRNLYVRIVSVRHFVTSAELSGEVPVRYRKGPLSQRSRVDWTGYKL